MLLDLLSYLPTVAFNQSPRAVRSQGDIDS
jgi:hypothetical protein